MSCASTEDMYLTGLVSPKKTKKGPGPSNIENEMVKQILQ